MTFKERLREEIEYKGVLIKEISAQIGISNNTFLSYINSRNVMPNVETAVKIAKALDVSVEYLVTGEDYFHNEKTMHLKEIIKDLSILDENTLSIIKPMIHTLVEK
jgi:transcriptional regulator with XRE-family HTH domain